MSDKTTLIPSDKCIIWRGHEYVQTGPYAYRRANRPPTGPFTEAGPYTCSQCKGVFSADAWAEDCDCCNACASREPADKAKPPIGPECRPETFVNTGQLIVHLKIKATELQAELKAVTGERDKYERVITRIRHHLGRADASGLKTRIEMCLEDEVKTMNEPCMCGDTACPHCGNPEEARLDTLTEDYCGRCGKWAREVYRELAKVTKECALEAYNREQASNRCLQLTEKTESMAEEINEARDVQNTIAEVIEDLVGSIAPRYIIRLLDATKGR